MPQPKARRGWNIRSQVARAFSEFLGMPTLIIVGFLVLAGVMYALDQADLGALDPVRAFMRRHVIGDAAATRSLLGSIASGVITLTSITFSILLLAVQQSAASLTSQVFDQFLRRRLNQGFFGFFVGSALYTLVILATVSAPFNPILAATVALVLTIADLYLVIVLLYVTINQMRPTVIIEAIHDHVLAARQRQMPFLRRMRSVPLLQGIVQREMVRSEETGFVSQINLDALKTAVESLDAEVEIILLCQVGSYVAYYDALAEVVSPVACELKPVVHAVLSAIEIVARRDIRHDPAFGIEQLESIGWTSISPAKANQAPGILTTRMLGDLVSRWSVPEGAVDAFDLAPPGQEPRQDVPVVYHDNVSERLTRSFEALAVVATTSKQYSIVIAIAQVYASAFARLPENERQRAESLILCILPTLDAYVMTADLAGALSDLEQALRNCGRAPTAAAVEHARTTLEARRGALAGQDRSSNGYL